MQLTVPPAVAGNIARAKSLLGRNETIRGLDALLAAISLFTEAKVVGRGRSGTEIALRECVDICNGNSVIRDLLRSLAKSDKAAIAYTPGQEAKLAAVLNIVRKALAEIEGARAQAAEEERFQRKESLFDTARKCFQSGEAPKGKAILRKLGEEFGEEKGVLADIGKLLSEAGFLPDAAAYFEQAVENFPRESGPYGELAACYAALREYEKAERLYRSAIREFGVHPRTLIHLGKIYIAWNKRDKAFDVLQQAARLDPANQEAAELFAKVDR